MAVALASDVGRVFAHHVEVDVRESARATRDCGLAAVALAKLLDDAGAEEATQLEELAQADDARGGATLRAVDVELRIAAAVRRGSAHDVEAALALLPPERRAKPATRALVDAVSSNDRSCVDALLSAGADPNAALPRAVRFPNLLAVLLDAGANPLGAVVDATRERSDEALADVLARVRPHPKLARTLANALFVAIIAEDASKIRLLLTAGADPRAKIEGTSLLSLAQKYARSRETLAEAGFSVRARPQPR
jgi:hypothetical protein